MTDRSVVWIYQLSSAGWSQEEFRLDVRERELVSWPVGSSQSSELPRPGERIILWWAKSGAAEYGVIGWGTIHGESFGHGVRWLPHPPTDRWAMSPLRSPEIEAAVNEIRGSFKRLTLFRAEGSDAIALIEAIKAADL